MIAAFPSNIFVSTIACRKCGVIDLPVLTPGVGPHKFKGSCSSCGKFAIWVSGKTPEEKTQQREAARQAAMSSKPPTVQQVRYLRALGDVQPPPATLLEASKRISALVAAKGGQV